MSALDLIMLFYHFKNKQLLFYIFLFLPAAFLGISLNIPFERRSYAHTRTYIHTYTHFRIRIWDARTRKCRFYRKARRRRSVGRYQRKLYKWPHPVDVWGRITDLKCEIVAKCAPSSSSRISVSRMNKRIHPHSRTATWSNITYNNCTA